MKICCFTGKQDYSLIRLFAVYLPAKRKKGLFTSTNRCLNVFINLTAIRNIFICLVYNAGPRNSFQKCASHLEPKCNSVKMFIGNYSTFPNEQHKMMPWRIDACSFFCSSSISNILIIFCKRCHFYVEGQIQASPFQWAQACYVQSRRTRAIHQLSPLSTTQEPSTMTHFSGRQSQAKQQ